MFIDEFLTEEFCQNNRFFAYDFNPKSGMYEISGRDFRKIKEKLLLSLTNMGEPVIFIQDANYLNRGELLLVHRHEGIDLRKDWAADTLKNIQSIWKRPVNLDTVFDGKHVFWTFDGNTFSEK
jgi:stage V sporulation protein R